MFYETLDNVESEKVPCPDVGEWVCVSGAMSLMMLN